VLVTPANVRHLAARRSSRSWYQSAVTSPRIAASGAEAPAIVASELAALRETLVEDDE
jgi:hypothetical protein